jgi:SAM-dependent methyltransferase
MDSTGNQGDCAVCGSSATPTQVEVLWPELIAQWDLSERHVALIDRREGCSCPDCGSSVRSAALAASILKCQHWSGTFDSWSISGTDLRVLEINPAGNLTRWLSRLPNHRLVEYPEVDMQQMDIPDASFDLVVHSDTLEHVADPVKALTECRRVLSSQGALLFTIPIVPDRLTRQRHGEPPSYHGTLSSPEYLVMTEYGADFWTQALDAGFSELRLDGKYWPVTVVLIAQP